MVKCGALCAGRPTCEEAPADPYFDGLSQLGREPSAQPVSKLAFDFERRKLNTVEVGPLLCTKRAPGGADCCCDRSSCMERNVPICTTASIALLLARCLACSGARLHCVCMPAALYCHASCLCMSR